MGINLNQLDKLVISHGHDDHTGGLIHFFLNKTNVELISHPECFNYKEDNHQYIGSSMKKDDLEKVCHLTLSSEPLKISKNIIYLGEIPSSNSFEAREAIGKCSKNDKRIDDIVIEDSAIVYKSEKGLFIITGCSHSGICNIIEYAKKVCHDDRIYGVIGGFHLFKMDNRLEKTIHYLKENNVTLLYPCHCVSLDVKIEIAKQLKINEVGVGLEINI